MNFLDFLLWTSELKKIRILNAEGCAENRRVIYYSIWLDKKPIPDKVAFIARNSSAGCFHERFEWKWDTNDSVLSYVFNEELNPAIFEAIYLSRLKQLIMQEPYEFAHLEEESDRGVYILKDVNNNARRLKAVITKDEYDNKIAKINQKFYKKA